MFDQVEELIKVEHQELEEEMENSINLGKSGQKKVLLEGDE